jgi:hypothetical protein
MFTCRCSAGSETRFYKLLNTTVEERPTDNEALDPGLLADVGARRLVM